MTRVELELKKTQNRSTARTGPRDPRRASRFRATCRCRAAAVFIHSFIPVPRRAREGGGVVVPWGRVYSSPSRSSIGFDDRIGYGSDTPN